MFSVNVLNQRKKAYPLSYFRLGSGKRRKVEEERSRSEEEKDRGKVLYTLVHFGVYSLQDRRDNED